jgi:hypothetical protein
VFIETLSKERKMMKAGKYYIGDLCYVMHDVWDEFCAITIDGNRCLDGEFELADGRKFATYGTAYGDGVYQTNVGGECSVDAGLIGCIRVEDIKDFSTYWDKLGVVVTFENDFETSEYKGQIKFGHVVIETDYEEDDSYEDEYYEDEE